MRVPVHDMRSMNFSNLHKYYLSHFLDYVFIANASELVEDPSMKRPMSQKLPDKECIKK